MVDTPSVSSVLCCAVSCYMAMFALSMTVPFMVASISLAMTTTYTAKFRSMAAISQIIGTIFVTIILASSRSVMTV
jgi:hypothetical protein